MSDFLDLFIDLIEANCNLETEISADELRAEGGIYAETGEGFAESEYYDKREAINIPVLIMCRHADQKICDKWLNDICTYLERLKSYPDGNNFAWINAKATKKPNKIGRDEDGVYHYSCIVTCLVYYY